MWIHSWVERNGCYKREQVGGWKESVSFCFAAFSIFPPPLQVGRCNIFKCSAEPFIYTSWCPEQFQN